jgi:uncharacterized protein YutE (UPF0331/DUF86 family)
VVDEERVTRLADAVLRDVGRLTALAQVEDLLHQPDQLDAVKYRFVTAIEGCVSIAHHVVASEGWAAPDSNSAAVTGLAEHGVVDTKTAASVASAAGFRNLLVHRYDAIDDSAVIGFLEHVKVIESFVGQVVGWLTEQESGAGS